MECGVQDVYWGSASIKGKEKKQNWAEGKVRLQSGTDPQKPPLTLQGALERAHPPNSSYFWPQLMGLSVAPHAVTGGQGPGKGSPRSQRAVETGLKLLTAEKAHPCVNHSRHFTLQRILSISIYLSKCTLNACFLP